MATSVKRTRRAKGAEAKVTGLVNHVAIVLDRSGSMSSIRAKVVSIFNQQLKTIAANAKKLDQNTFLSSYTFSSQVDKPKFFAKPVAKVQTLRMKDYSPAGGTALLDGCGTAITDLQTVKGASRDNVSFLVIVITDGEENTSRKFKKSLKGLINKVQKTGRWSIVFLVPKSGVSVLTRFGIPAGNIQSWEATAKGAEEMGRRIAQGVDNFYTARSTGQRAVRQFFTTDMTKVDTATLQKNLNDLSGTFQKWPIPKEVSIRDFVNGKLSASPSLSKKYGTSYKPGNGYYELTKPEDVQEQKHIAIMDKGGGAIYGGDQARALLGLPIGAGTCRVKPGNHMNFAIFVESTSLNRKLVRGTSLLYRAP